MFLDIVFVLVSLILLWKGADWLVEGAVALSLRLGVSQLVIGLTVVAFGTSAPEFAVTVGAAVQGQMDISVSNIIGSNIFNLGFIMGGVAMISACPVPEKLVRRDGLVLVLMSGLIFFMLLNMKLGRLEGIVLSAGFIGYLILLFFEKREINPDAVFARALPVDIIILITGTGMVLAGGILLRSGAVGIARAAGLSEWIIGATIVAFGTSAPELVASLVATLKKHHSVSIGNLIGSCIFNGLGVLGLAGFLRPLTVTHTAWQSALLLFALVLIAVFFLKTRKSLYRLEGAVLAGLSVGIYIFLILIERGGV
jgi:cation:H+ antiporter